MRQHPTERRNNAAHGPRHVDSRRFVPLPVQVRTGQFLFTSGPGKLQEVFTVRKPEIHCPWATARGKQCGRLLGKGAALDFETVCPRCGATLQISQGKVKVLQPAKRNGWRY